MKCGSLVLTFAGGGWISPIVAVLVVVVLLVGHGDRPAPTADGITGASVPARTLANEHADADLDISSGSR